jgi:hypothetical protein
MMRGASGDECGNLLGQEYNRPARPQCLKSPGKRLYLYFLLQDGRFNNTAKIKKALEIVCGLTYA